jgi:hypothetical protein
MSIIETLTEGIVNRNMEQEGAALLNKWTQTGLLEGLNAAQSQNMAVLLENQAKQLLKESSSMAAGGNVDGFAAVAFPIVRRVFAGLIANDLVSVQPMSLPSGLIFFLDFTFSGNINDASPDGANQRFGNVEEKSIYGTDQVGAQIINGVDLIDARKGDLSGPRGMTGEAFGSPEGHCTALAANVADAALKASFVLDGSVSAANKKLLQFDPDLLSSTDSTLGVIIVDVEEDKMTNPDFDNLSAFSFAEINADTIGANNTVVTFLNGNAALSIAAADVTGGFLSQIRRLTTRVSAADAATTGPAVRFYIVGTQASLATPNGITVGTAGTVMGALTLGTAADPKLQIPAKDTATDGAGTGVIDTFTMLLEGTGAIPEIDIKVDSTAITAQTKKLKAKWTPELGQDLNAYHNIDAEVELTSILSEQIALEIDREILADLVNGATAATFYWSRSPGLFLDRSTGAEIGANKAAPDFTGTVSEWYETLIETINDVSAQIHRKTLRGGATHVVCSPEVANILEFTAGFRANVTADADKGDIGAVKAGSLNRKFDVIVDPYFPRNVVLVGRIGSSFLESGYVYAPYVPLQVTPTIFGVEDFVPRKGVMTRYAKKMVRPDMYGLVIVRGLLGEQYT